MLKYCTKRFREQDGITYYSHIYGHILSTEACVNKNEPIYKIDVREATESEKYNTPYYGFLDNEGIIDNVYPVFSLLDICFAYGVRAEEKIGRGKIIKVVISELSQERIGGL